MEELSKCRANCAPLTPLTFLKRASGVYADRTSLIYEGTRFTWRQTYHRCRRLASALRFSLNISEKDVVSVLAPNVPALYEMHFAVPMAGAVLNTINTRLNPKNVATILRHSEAKLFFVDCQFLPLAKEALQQLAVLGAATAPLLVLIDDIDSPTGVQLGEIEYEQLLCAREGREEEMEAMVDDEWDPIALNYTSGTTSAPKGAVYSHRGAYLSTLSLILGWEMGTAPVYLWSLPMFHCNGWTFTWGVAARGGTNVCLRNTTAHDIYRSIDLHNVTHMCCAPVVFNILIDGTNGGNCRYESIVGISKRADPVQVLTGGAPPPPALVEKIEGMGFRVTHAFGMTEATGPALVCEWQRQWERLPAGDKARLKARQGVSVLSLAGVDVKDPTTMVSVPRDGKTMGEIVLQGSSLMKGYFKDAEATARAFNKESGGGWFSTGDIGVVHPDGYIEIKDRSKDVIISGGENISSVEVESVLYGHPRVKEAAVVAMPHPRWGESPCAFVNFTDTANAACTESEIVSYCRGHLPGFMVPKKVVVLEELPKTSTGKIQKFQLRALAKALVNGKSKVNEPQLTKPCGPRPHQRHHGEEVLGFSRL